MTVATVFPDINPKFLPKETNQDKRTMSVAEMRAQTTIPRSRVSVYNQDLLEDLISSAHDDAFGGHTLSEASLQRRARAAQRRAEKLEREKEMELMALRKAQARESKAEIDKKVVEATKRRRAQNSNEHERRFMKLTAQLEEGETFVQGIAENLKYHDEAQNQKKVELAKQWNAHVYENIKDNIHKKLDATPVSVISKRKQDMLQKYIDASNAKTEIGGIFLDIIIEHDYDPLADRKNSIKYSTKELFDPPKKDIQKTQKEKSQMADFPEQVVKYPGRYTLKTDMWDKLEATPYGRFNKMMGEKKENRPSAVSNIVLDHYNVPVYEEGYKVLAKEFADQRGRGRRAFRNWKPGQAFQVD